MRRLVAALVLVLALAGCGGGGEQAASGASAPTATAPAAPPPAPTAPAAAPVIDNSPTETVTFERLPLSASAMPESISERLETAQPMLILFYDGKQKATDDVRAEVDSVLKKYRGMIDLVAFDVAYALTPKGEKDANAQKASIMTAQLGIRVTPYILILDKGGLETARFAGFVDRSILEREVLRATD